MEENTIFQAVQYLCRPATSLSTTLFVAFEEWAQAACSYAAQKSFVTTIEALVERHSFFQMELFSSPHLYFIPMDSFGKKEREKLTILQQQTKDTLLLFPKTADKKYTDGFVSFIFPKCKPWELATMAQGVVRFLLAERQMPVVEKAVLLLAEGLLQQPGSFASEMEKYRCFSYETHVTDMEIEALLCGDKPVSLWKLFDAFVARDKKTLFQQIDLLEDTKEVHPLQLIRFFRSQWEKMLLLSESNEPLSFASQRQKRELFRKKTLEEKRYVLEHLLLYDKAFREGEVPEDGAFVPLFMKLLNGPV